MKTLALDQASRCSGWSFFEDQSLKQHGTFTFTDPSLGDRLYKIQEKVRQLIQTYQPDFVVLEEIQMQSQINNVETFKALAQVQGVIICLLVELNIKYEIYLAGTWRKGLGIIGRKRDEQKKNAQRWVFDTYGIKTSEDASDAICIGAFGSGIRCKKQEPEELGFDWS